MAEIINSSAKAKSKVDRIIELINLSKVFGSKTVVDDISLGIKRGEFVTLLGPSGCGKTTTLRMIAGFEMPTEGTVFIDGVDVTKVPPHLRQVNTVFQRYALFPHLNVFDNIAFGLKLKQIPNGEVEKNGKMIPKTRKYTKAEISEKVERALKLVDLEEYGKRDVSSLSGGQQQRVAIARALVNQPSVLLLDEPLGALDLKMRKEMQLELMRMHRELGITFIYVTHDQEEALTMSDTIVVMNNGTLQQIGTPKQIYDEPSNAFVADFIGESNIMSAVMLEDYKVKFADVVFECLDKGFEKNEAVDLVIRPEDIAITKADDKAAQLVGEVTASVFKGDYTDMEVLAGDYEFSVQVINGEAVGTKVGLIIAPNSIHIMKKTRIINEFKAEVTSDGMVSFEGGTFECDTNGFSSGDTVRAVIRFEDIEVLDDIDESHYVAKVVSSLYKGKHYQLILRSDDAGDDGIDIYCNSIYEYNVGDQVGVNIAPTAIRLERIAEGDADE